MSMRGKRFEIDRENGKLLGVCAGLANHTGIDATIFRVGLVLVTMLGAFPWTLIAYGVAVPRRAAAEQRPPAMRRPRRLTARKRASGSAASICRMQAIETYVTSSNSRLAREIEDLR